MLKFIFVRELQDHIKSRRILVSFLVSFTLFLLSGLVMKEEYHQEMNDFQNRSSLNQQWRTKEITRIDRPVSALTSIVSGLAGKMGNSAILTADKSPEITESVGDNVASTLFPSVDLLFIAGMVMSLFALFFAHNSVCGEKENRTLALMLSNSAPRHTILLGKWLAGYLAITVVFFISFLINLLVLSTSNGVRFSSTDAISILLIGLIVFVTLGVFYLLGIFISTWVKNTRMAAFWGLLVWFFLVLVWPNVAVELAKHIKKSPTPQFLARQERLIRTDSYRWMQEECSKSVNEQKTDSEKQFVADKIMWDGYRTVKDRIRKVEADAEKELKAQINLGKVLSCLSPYANFAIAVTDIANTGLASESAFRQTVASYDQQYFGYFHGRLINRVQEYWGDPENAPIFQYRFLSVSERILVVLPQIGMLLFWCVLFFVGAFVSFLRYDVR